MFELGRYLTDLLYICEQNTFLFSLKNEVKSMLYLFEDVNYLPLQTLTQLHKEVDDALNLTGGFIRYIQKRLGE